VVGLLAEGLWLGLSTLISFMPIIFHSFNLMVALIEDSGLSGARRPS